MMKFLVMILKLINAINLLSMLMFIPGVYGVLLLKISEDQLTSNIALNQVVIALIADSVIGLYAEMHRVPRPDTGFAIIKESSKTAKVLTAAVMIICICACIKLHLEPAQYILVCSLQALGVLTSSRCIRKLKIQIKD